MGVALSTNGFDHRVAGTPAAIWAASGLVEQTLPLAIDGLRRLIVIAAHPDDETLGAGGLIAAAAGCGVAVTVVVATAGEASHPASPTVVPSALAARRRAEVRAAVSALSPAAVLHQLDLGDGRLAAAVAELTGEIASLVGASGVGCWLVAPWGDDRHPDHTAAAQAAQAVADTTGCRLLEYPLWAWHWARPGDGTLRPDMLTALHLSPAALAAKDTALAEHRSQIEPLSAEPGDEAIVPPGFREHFRGAAEIYVDSSRVCSPAQRTPASRSLDLGYFDGFYSDGVDPWGFQTRWYEERKRAITLACLPRERFASAFEPGCAIGVLTQELAPRCDRLLATDISDIPLAQAGRRLAGEPGVRIEQRRIPQDWPTGPFDLIVLSEIGYYCAPTDLSQVIAAAVSSLTADGVLLACHWRHPVADYPMSGDDVHRLLRRESGLAVLAEHLEEDFRIDVLVRAPVESVARRDGLLG